MGVVLFLAALVAAFLFLMSLSKQGGDWPNIRMARFNGGLPPDLEDETGQFPPPGAP